MLIFANPAAAKAYVPFTDHMRNLTRSAQRLATGDNFANPNDGTGELGIADRMRLNITGTHEIISSLESAAGYAASQDEILGHISDITTRMSELAASSVDQTKTSAERTALNTEFRSLDLEVQELASNSKYNSQALFGTTTTIRIGVETTDTITFSQVNLAALTFVAMSLLSFTTASAALISLRSRATSLTQLRNIARGHHSRVQRTISFSQNYVANLQQAENKIRDVDVAIEMGAYTKQQIQLQAAQSIIAQLNNLSQGDLRFFQ